MAPISFSLSGQIVHPPSVYFTPFNAPNMGERINYGLYNSCRIWFIMIDTPPGQAVKKRGAGWDGIKSGGQEEEEAD